MKKKKTDLNVDFIGGLGPLTKQEERALSEFFRNRKSMRKRFPRRNKVKALSKQKVTA